jgi:DNA-binding FadR family transcriptional regulator
MVHAIDMDDTDNTTAPEALAALLSYIAERKLNVGDALPPERQLAEHLSISRRTLRMALAKLELEGRIWRGVGRGTYLGSRPQKFASRFDTLFRDTSPADVMQTRFIVEPGIVAIAAAQATAEELKEIERCVRNAMTAHDDESWQLWDHRFHYLLARSTRNQALIALVEAMNNARAQPGWRSIREATVGEQGRRTAAAQHKAILDALLAHDAEAASRAMRDHLIGARALLLL